MISTISIYYDKSLLLNPSTVPRYDAKIFHPPKGMIIAGNLDAAKRFTSPIVLVYMWKGAAEPPPGLDELATWLEYKGRYITHGRIEIARGADDETVKMDVDEFIQASYDVELSEAALYYEVLDQLQGADRGIIISGLEYHSTQVEYVLRNISLRTDYAKYDRTKISLETVDNVKVTLYAGVVGIEQDENQGGKVIEFDFMKAAGVKPTEPAPKRTQKKSTIKNPRKPASTKKDPPANPRKKK